MFFLGVYPFFVYAQVKNTEEIPPGMEVITIGATRVVVPRGSRITKKGGLVILEGINEYVSRRLLDMEQSIKEIEAREHAIEETLQALQNMLDELQKAASLTGENNTEE